MMESSAKNKSLRELERILKEENTVENLKGYDEEYLKNFCTESGYNLLHLAIQYPDDSVIKYLLNIGCNLNQKTVEDGRTPLNYYLARSFAHYSMIKYFVDAGANLSWTYVGDKSGTLQIYGKDLAISFYQILLQKSLYYTKIDDESEKTKSLYRFLCDLGWPVDGIASLRNEDLTMYTFERQGLLKSYHQLIIAIKLGDALQLNSVLKNNVLTDHTIITCKALLEASKSPSSKSEIIIKLLIDKGALINGFFEDEEDDIPLCEAYKLNYLNIIWFLLDNGADVTYLNWIDQIMDYYDSSFNSLQKKIFFLEKSKCLAFLLQHDVLCGKKYLEPNFFKKFLSYFIANGHGMEENDDTDVPYRCYYTQPVIKWLAKLHNLKHEGRMTKNFLKSEFLKEFFYEVYNEEELDPLYREKFISYFDHYFDSCNNELIKMKSFWVCGNNTAWDLLSKSIEKLVPCVRNGKLIGEINVLSLEKKFPIYSDTLNYKISKAHERALQIDKSVRVLSKCLPVLGFNYLILEMIVKYLGMPNTLILN